MPETTPHVVIAGGGFGGLGAARALASGAVRVTLLDRHNYHLFQPLLYQVATAGLSPGDIASPIRWMLRRQRNTRVLLAELRSVDPDRGLVRLDGGDMAYDYLVLATGASHSYFGHEEWERYAPGLKTLDDALLIRKRVLLAYEHAERTTDPNERRRLLTFVVVGGGPTGVELAGALAEIARHTLRHEFRSFEPGTSRVMLFEAAPDILAMYPPDLQAAAERSLRRLGVEVRKNSPVTSRSSDRAAASFRAWPRWPSSRDGTPRRTSCARQGDCRTGRFGTATTATWPPSGALPPSPISARCTCRGGPRGWRGSFSTS